ncbi:hypothetical protein EDB92DRAFT_1181731 [Lactarius akahatsu]|uniref:Uncharacterized protein n=1 Tax=Lactarius akahatsu TaxID=416441 RepID=A0AAD4QGY3_9AGAM|nr:hypothetical protein EDB92DRAFT_1181731 [Lactarius akahatsu]
MDIITPETAYTFDQSKPSPIDQFSSSLEELHRSPADGESTARLRTLRQTEARNPTFRPNGDSQSAKAPVSPRIGQADRLGMGHVVGRLVSVYEERNTRRIDLQAQHRKKNMKPRQRQMEKLPITLQDPYATRSSDFVSGPGPSKGKTTRKGVSLQFTLRKMVYRSGHPSTRSNTISPCQSHMGSEWSPQSATRGLLNSFRAMFQ